MDICVEIQDMEVFWDKEIFLYMESQHHTLYFTTIDGRSKIANYINYTVTYFINSCLSQTKWLVMSHIFVIIVVAFFIGGFFCLIICVKVAVSREGWIQGVIVAVPLEGWPGSIDGNYRVITWFHRGNGVLLLLSEN